MRALQQPKAILLEGSRILRFWGCGLPSQAFMATFVKRRPAGAWKDSHSASACKSHEASPAWA